MLLVILRLSDSDTEDPRRGCLRGGWWGWGWSFKGLVDKEWRVKSWKVRWWFIHSHSCSHSLCHCKCLHENDVPSDIQWVTIHFIISDNISSVVLIDCRVLFEISDGTLSLKRTWPPRSDGIRSFSDWGDESSFQVRTKEWVCVSDHQKVIFIERFVQKISSSNRYTDLVSFCTRIMGAAKRSCMYSRAIFHFHDIGEEEYNIEFTFFEPWHIRWKYVKVPRS